MEKTKNNKAINLIKPVEDNMFIGSVFCVDLPKLEQPTSLKNGALFGINHYLDSNEY